MRLPLLSYSLVSVCSLVVLVAFLRDSLGLFFSIVIGISLAVGLAALGAYRITQPLNRLKYSVQRFTQEGFIPQSHAWQAIPIREIHELKGALESLIQSLSSRIEELTSQRNHATVILESMAEGVIAVDAQGRILLMNPSAGILLGISQDSVGRSLFERVRHLEVHELIQRVLSHHQQMVKEMTLFQPTERVLRIQGLPSERSQPQAPTAILVIQDITEHSLYERLRKEFVANVSHELKTPLTTICSLTETLLEGALNDPSSNRRFIELIDQDATRLSRLIDDLLALSEIESQAVLLKLSRVELIPLMNAMLSSLKQGIEQRRLRVSVQFPEGLSVRADPDRLRQVLLNLLDNSIKYNKEGGEIMIRAIREDSWVKITVADTGIGMAEEDLPRIFERFYRVEKSRSRELGGTGLGLSIVKHIVESHGGKISVTSRIHQGSTFSFTLPFCV